MTTFSAPSANRPLARWANWSLATQFAVAGGIVMLVAMVLIGRWVATRIEDSVVRNTANATAQYMESFISPLSQDLAKSDTLSPGATRALEEIFTNTPLGQRVVSFKIWKTGGLVIEASDKSVIGKTFPVYHDLETAWSGQVAASFAAPDDPENQGERALGIPLLEIYSPIREVWSGKVIGVAEFYEVATDLSDDLAAARRNSWLAGAAVMLLIGGSLYAIVLRGSNTIDTQRVALTQQLERLTELSRHNNSLRLRVQNAAARASAMNDQSLRQIGADLHDGPAQLMGFAALRLDDLRAGVSGPAAMADLAAVERAVKDAIKEIRSVARGLSLPDIEQRPVGEIVQSVADAHAARTGTKVSVHVNIPPTLDLAPAVKICAYRFVQEGLYNAWRHADGKGQQVDASYTAGVLHLQVSDQGPGFADASAVAPTDMTLDTRTGSDAAAEGGMGLVGLRNRVESLGGTFELANRPATRDAPGGATLKMTLELKG